MILSFKSSIFWPEPPTGITVHAVPISTVNVNYVTPASTIFAGTQQNSMALHHLNVDTNKTSNEAEEAIVAAAINEEEGTITAAAIAHSRKCTRDAVIHNLDSDLEKKS